MQAPPNARVVVEPNTNVVRVHVSAETLYNLPATQQIINRVLNRLGCQGCHSGRQIIFQQEAEEFNI
jgi:hypothetical protein